MGHAVHRTARRPKPCAAGLAGVAGIEPANAGVKVPCLTAWLHPTVRTGIREMGWVMGLEPTTSRATIWRSNQLNYTHHNLARPKGFEPLTYGLEGRCSIRLSYRRTPFSLPTRKPPAPADS